MHDLGAAANAHTTREQLQRARPIPWGSSGRRFKSCQPDVSKHALNSGFRHHLQFQRGLHQSWGQYWTKRPPLRGGSGSRAAGNREIWLDFNPNADT